MFTAVYFVSQFKHLQVLFFNEQYFIYRYILYWYAFYLIFTQYLHFELNRLNVVCTRHHWGLQSFSLTAMILFFFLQKHTSDNLVLLQWRKRRSSIWTSELQPLMSLRRTSSKSLRKTSLQGLNQRRRPSLTTMVNTWQPFSRSLN